MMTEIFANDLLRLSGVVFQCLFVGLLCVAVAKSVKYDVFHTGFFTGIDLLLTVGISKVLAMNDFLSTSAKLLLPTLKIPPYCIK